MNMRIKLTKSKQLSKFEPNAFFRFPKNHVWSLQKFNMKFDSKLKMFILMPLRIFEAITNFESSFFSSRQVDYDGLVCFAIEPTFTDLIASTFAVKVVQSKLCSQSCAV